MEIIKKLETECMKKTLPEFNVGDVVEVRVKIKEGEKERVQGFTGTVIKVKGGRKGIQGTFTVRRIVQGEGVERVFPFHSPAVQNVVVKRPGQVRRAKLYYLRDRVGKATKVKERRDDEARGGSKAKRKAAARKAKAKKEVPVEVES
jgi:large subunit ribosomal protein L19